MLKELGLQTVINADATSINCNSTILVYDPPWDNMIPVDFDRELVLYFCDPHRASDAISIVGMPDYWFVWDCVSSWYVPNRPLKRAKFCMVRTKRKWNATAALLDKPQPAKCVMNTRGIYVSEARSGTQLSEVYTRPITQMDKLYGHEKPIEWIRAIIAGFSVQSDTLYDPFAGSGAVAVASMQLGVKSTHVEINESRFNLICNRLQHYGCPINNDQLELLF